MPCCRCFAAGADVVIADATAGILYPPTLSLYCEEKHKGTKEQKNLFTGIRSQRQGLSWYLRSVSSSNRPPRLTAKAWETLPLAISDRGGMDLARPWPKCERRHRRRVQARVPPTLATWEYIDHVPGTTSFNGPHYVVTSFLY